ncbi:sodium:solute symporter [Bacillus sp. M6-12]|uniref:monocarboxylate uptake permease MctP n=1 Tax=Bacillus sp. M6-12 TaxID=2054166 RepID=UPI000C75FB6E|nr:sodium:solute symporter [Bacillus sp. M6-12]PLS15268.1 sodium:solute symporter [Bacillus sp. M6-12]
MNWTAFSVFLLFFAFVTVLGFVSAKWRRGDMDLIDEWGLAGRRFGTVVTWFLLGGDLYSAYTIIAVPAAVYAVGASGFFAIPYAIIMFPFFFMVMPRLWSVAKKHGYITASDFVKDRYGSGFLALVIAITGILATMPFLALQLVGMQAVLDAMGLTGKMPLTIAFLILAVYTYNSGLRAPASIAIVKDLMLWVTIIAAVICILFAFDGGIAQIFSAAEAKLSTNNPPGSLILQPERFVAYATLALGSAMALFLYPHSLTAIFSSTSRNALKKNAALLPAYTIILGILALLGFVAIALNVQAKTSSEVIPQLFLRLFPDWFSGFAFAAIAIGALVPAAIMSIAAANLFTRNIYREYINKNCTPKQETNMAKLISLLVKMGALFFVVLMSKQDAINLQLLGGIWILQILPAVVIGLYTNWFHRWGLLVGWLCGMGLGTYMAISQNLGNLYPLQIGGQTVLGYAGFYALIVNISVSAAVTVVIRAVGMKAGVDKTSVEDFEVL